MSEMACEFDRDMICRHHYGGAICLVRVGQVIVPKDQRIAQLERALREKDSEIERLKEKHASDMYNAGTITGGWIKQYQAKDALVGRLVSLLREWHEDWIAGGESDYLDAPTKALLAEIAPTPSAWKR